MSSESAETLQELIVIDELTGEQEHWGAIAAKRIVGNSPVYLTFTEPCTADDGGIWWIVWRDGEGLKKVGYVVARRQTCWETFTTLDERILAALYDSAPIPN